VNFTPGTARRKAVSAAWPTARISVSAASVSSWPVGCGKPESSSSIISTVISVERGDRVQPVDADAFALGFLSLFLMSRHLRPGAPVDNHRVVRAEAAGHPRGVHRGIAAAVHSDPAADHRARARGDIAEERHSVHDAAGVAGRDIHVLGQVRADGHEHRVEVPPRAVRRPGR
jgi:hypothetical protein